MRFKNLIEAAKAAWFLAAAATTTAGYPRAQRSGGRRVPLR
jgi:hypothetical protein